MKNYKKGSALVTVLIIILLAGLAFFIYNSINSRTPANTQPAAAATTVGVQAKACLELNAAGPLASGQKYCEISVIAPLAKDTLVIGKQYTTKWIGTQNNVKQYTVYLVKGDDGNVKVVQKLDIGQVSTKSLTFTIPNVTADSDYRIQLGEKSVARSAMFSIATTTPIVPVNVSVTITSPNQSTSRTPTISGTATGLTQLGVVLSGQYGDKVYASGLIPVVNGKWSVTVSPALEPGQYSVSIYDSKNNQLEKGFNLRIVSVPPPTSTAVISTRLSPNSPAYRTVTVSPSQITKDVVLGVFGLKSQNVGAMIKGIGFDFANTDVLSNVVLSVGGQKYAANSLVPGGTTFTNINIPLAVDQWIDVTVTADIAPGNKSNGVKTYVTLKPESITGITSVEKGSKPVDAGNALRVTSNSVVFVQSGVSVSNTSATRFAIIGPIGKVFGTIGYNVSFSFTLTNRSNNDVSVSKNPSSAVWISRLPGTTASSTINSVMATPNILAGDTSTSYNIPAGNSRSLTLNGILSSSSGGYSVPSFFIEKIYYTSGGNLYSISEGLVGLYASGEINNTLAQ